MRRDQRKPETGGVLPLTGMRIGREKGTRMRHFLIRVTLAATAAILISPVQAQVPSPAAAPPQWPQWPPAAYPGGTYQYHPIPAPTPRDAYREGLINRWELEQLEGPLPPALQGPSVDGTRGGDGGGGDRGG